MCLSSWATASIDDVINAGEGKTVYAQQLCVVVNEQDNLFVMRKAEG